MVSALVLVARWWAAGEGVGCAVGARVLGLRGSGALGVIGLVSGDLGMVGKSSVSRVSAGRFGAAGSFGIWW